MRKHLVSTLKTPNNGIFSDGNDLGECISRRFLQIESRISGEGKAS